MHKARADIVIGGKKIEFNFDLNKFSQNNIYEFLELGGLYEPETVKALESILRPGDTFVDVGAHVGYFSLIGSALVGETGTVVAYEPNRDNFEALLDHVIANDALNVEPMLAAVLGGGGLREIYVNLDNDGGHAFWDVGKHAFNQRSRATPTREKVLVRTLDDLLCMTGGVRAMKIDTEGAEHAILNGGLELLKRNPECAVICEVNRFGLEQMGSSEADLRGMMTGLGYRTWLLAPDSEAVTELQPGETYGRSDIVFNVLFRK